MPHTPKRSLAACAIVLALLLPAANAQTVGPEPSPASQGLLFAVEIKTGPAWDSARPPHEQRLFREHSAHLKRLRDAGHILVGARYSDKGLLILSAKSIEGVRALMDQDPSMAAGTFRYEAHEFNVFYAGTLQVRPRP